MEIRAQVQTKHFCVLFDYLRYDVMRLGPYVIETL